MPDDVVRNREQVAGDDSVRDASAKAAATSGASVVAAGLIVMVAIAGLLVIGIPLIGKLGIAAALGVGAVVVSALTILPIMIGALGRRLKPTSPPTSSRRARSAAGARSSPPARGSRSPRAVLALLIFAAPVTQLRLGQPDDGNQPVERTQRVAYDQLSRAFGPGSNGPFLLAVDTPKGDPATQEQLAELRRAVAGTDGAATVAPPAPSRDGEMATIFAVPETASHDARTSDLLASLREQAIPRAT